MQATRKIVKVFIASPSDLNPERTIAREVVDEFNLLSADSSGYQIEMVGWEETVGSMGRPQAIINKDLARCELFIGMLWKRWGTPPDLDGKYTSGFEEEFSISVERNKNENVPQISMFFKEIDSELQKDPGLDLQKVMKFREDLIKDKKILFENFTDLKDFEKRIRRRLFSYVNDLIERDKKDNTNEKINPSNISSTYEEMFDDVKSNLFFSPQSVTFINLFLKDVQKSGIEKVTPENIAYFRLLANILNTMMNDDTALGVHDANLIYINSGNFNFGENELGGLILSGFENYDAHNTPLWRWLSRCNKAPETFTLIAKDHRKRRIIDCLRFMSHDIKEERELYLNNWLTEERNEAVKIAAIKYLSEKGTKNDIAIIQNEYEINDVRTNSTAIDAIISINFRDGVSEGFDKILEYQPSNISSNVIELMKTKKECIENEKLMLGINSKSKELRLFCINILIERNYLREIQLTDFLLHEDFEIRYICINQLAKHNFELYKEKSRSILIKDDYDKKDSSLYDKFVRENLYKEDKEKLQ